MNILINLTNEKLDILNKYKKGSFSNTSGDVAIVIEGHLMERVLDKAIKLGLPTVVLAGVYSNRDNPVTEKCLSYGLMPQSLIFKNKDILIDYTGETVFTTKVPRGVGLNGLLEIANYAVKNNLLPEFIVWNPTEEEFTKDVIADEKVVVEIREPAHAVENNVVTSSHPNKSQEKATRDNIESFKTIKGEQKTSKQQEPKKVSKIHKIELDTYLASYEQIVLLLELSSNSNILPVINDLQNKYPATLLEINNELGMFSRYASSREKAIETGNYSYFKDGYIYAANQKISNKVLLIDIELLGDYSDLINDLYEKANKKIFIPSDVYEEEELLILKDWKNNSLSIDAVIVSNESMYDIYTKEIGEVVYYNNEVVL